MVHHCELPPLGSFYDVYKCPTCKQWWRRLYRSWEITSRLDLILTGHNRECRSFLRHNKKGAA